MKRLPIVELVVVAVVVVAAILITRATDEAEVIVRNEWACFAMMNRLDRSAPIPADLSPVEGTSAYRHEGYLYTVYVPSPTGPVAADLASVLAGEGPYLALAWPETWDVSGRRAFVVRSPGFVLQVENDERTLSGLPVPECPWPEVAAPRSHPINPLEGAPRPWVFLHRKKQKERLEGLGLVYIDRSGRKDR